MNPIHRQEENCHILYDDTVIGQVTRDWFSPEYWQAQHAIAGQALGRGTTWFVDYQSHHWVLRRYRRGGMVAKLLGERYLWTGLTRSRAWREWHMLAQLHSTGLPVPAPVAVMVCRFGMYYRAALLTKRIADCRTLAAQLRESALPENCWRAIGGCLRRLHDAGADHADLNAHNILLDKAGKVYVIDFDRGVLRNSAGIWQQRNLSRLQHSLQKLAQQYSPFYFRPTDFVSLLEAYNAR